MHYVGLGLSSKSTVASAVNERERCLFEGEAPPTRAGLVCAVHLVAALCGNSASWSLHGSGGRPSR